MGLTEEYTDGQTPIDEDELLDLKLGHITRMSELNEAEQLNIQQAVEWVMRKAMTKQMVLTEEFVKALHVRMYGDVWKWAGQFRASNKNIGVEYQEIGVHLRQLLDDTVYWIDHSTYPPDEIAIRFKHRLVSIHCFPNGNGRHSRLMADIIINKLFGLPMFSWGTASPDKGGVVRQDYLAAVKKADEGDVLLLIKFARS